MGHGSAREADAWRRDSWVWDAYFGLVYVISIIHVFGIPLSPPVRTTAILLLTVCVPWYVLLGRRVLRVEDRGSPPAKVYVTGLILLFIPVAVLAEHRPLMLFVLTPQCYMALQATQASVTVVVVNVLPLAGWLALDVHHGRELLNSVAYTIVVIAFSLAFGSWLNRIIGQSIERAELIGQLDASREEVARLSAAHGALTERERLSREIHDTLAQGFTSIVMLAQAVESELDTDPGQARRHLAFMAGTARDNLAEARALVAALGPAPLDCASLVEALRRLGERLGAETGAGVEVRVTGEPRRLPAAVEVVALRSCQEALANVRKHAGAGRIAVDLAYEADRLRLTVGDDGRGFDPASPTGGYGLAGLRARAGEIGGTATVASAAGKGTRVHVDIPLQGGRQ